MQTYTTAEIFTDMEGEFPEEFGEIAVEMIRVAYSAYRQGLGTFWQTTYTEGEYEGSTIYASYRDFRESFSEFAHVTVEDEDGEQQGFRVRFVASVDLRHPEYASVERW